MTEPRLPVGTDPDAESHGSALRVLFVEASGYCAGALEETSPPGRFTIVLARDSQEALKYLREGSYEAIVIELPVPEETAAQLLDGIAELDPQLSRRVAFLVNDLGDSLTRGILTEARRPFLTQPVDPGQMSDLITRIGLEGPQQD